MHCDILKIQDGVAIFETQLPLNMVNKRAFLYLWMPDY